VRGDLFRALNEGAVKKYRTNPRKIQATVLSKRTASAAHFVAFAMPDDKRMEMGVSKQDFDSLNDDDRCELTIENGQCVDVKRI